MTLQTLILVAVLSFHAGACLIAATDCHFRNWDGLCALFGAAGIIALLSVVGAVWSLS